MAQAELDIRPGLLRTHAAILAHYDNPQAERPTGLCGTPLMGIRAPQSSPMCIVCEDLHEPRGYGD